MFEEGRNGFSKLQIMSDLEVPSQSYRGLKTDNFTEFIEKGKKIWMALFYLPTFNFKKYTSNKLPKARSEVNRQADVLNVQV